MDYIFGQFHDKSLLTLSDAERRQHIYIVGRSGTGKSTLLTHLMLSDLSRGRGFALLDPHGDLARTIAGAVPQGVEAIYLDPLDSHVVGYNPIAKVPPLHRGTVAANIVSSFRHIWRDSWGARMNYILTNTVRLLLEDSGDTYALTDINDILTDKSFRTHLLQHCDDPYIVSFWKDEYANYSDKFRSEAIAPIQNKAGQFSNNPILRDILKGTSTIDIKDIMDTGKVLLCNLSSKMGEEPAQLLGSLLVTAFSQAAHARDTERRDFTLYVDEFQNFATDTFASILSEARKFRLSLVLAHQYQYQVPEALRHAVMGNAGTIVCFRIGAYDAPLLAKEMGTSERDLLDLANRTARVRTMSDQKPTEALMLYTLPVPPLTDRFDAVLAHTRNRYARRRYE